MKNTAAVYNKLIRTLLPTITAYLEQSQSGQGLVLKQEEASKLAQLLDLKHWIKKGGLTPDTANEFLVPYLEHSQHMQHPRYIGHQVSSNHIASAVADFIQGAINNPMAIYEMGPSASVVEQTIINWMLEKAGWLQTDDITNFDYIPGNGGGILTHGGSMANLTVMLAARAAIAPDAWQDGTPPDLAVMGSESAHYSITRSISIIGMGKQAFVPVKSTAQEVLMPDDLPMAFKEAKKKGKRVMAVIANACATSTGLYDPIKEIGEFCKEEKLWFHIDGAHGASALTHPETAHYLDGISLADSMIWDTHKMLRTTTLCAAALFKDSKHLHNTFQQKGSYLFHDKEQPGFDLMPYAIECTKAAIGSKLFWVLAAEGEAGVGSYVQGRYAATAGFYEFFTNQPDFECPFRPEANILCFRYSAGAATNEYQLALRNKLVKEGFFYITSTEVTGIRYLRMTVINELTTLSDIEALAAAVRKIALSFLA